jgi:pimeloyl-ACP methyl ester carboxylesterase
MARPVIIIHGSYHQPEHYEPLTRLLRQATDTVVVPDIGQLPLAESTAMVQEIVAALAEPPVVVAHSFGGAVGGALHGVAQLVFLSAFVLDEDETAVSVLQPAAAEDPGGAAAFMAALRPSADGRLLSIDPERAGDLFFNGCQPEAVRRGVELLRPDIAANFDAAPTAAEWRHVPSLYVRTSRDHTWPAPLPPMLASRCTRSTTIAAGHSPYISHPGAVAELVRACL